MTNRNIEKPSMPFSIFSVDPILFKWVIRKLLLSPLYLFAFINLFLFSDHFDLKTIGKDSVKSVKTKTDSISSVVKDWYIKNDYKNKKIVYSVSLFLSVFIATLTTFVYISSFTGAFAYIIFENNYCFHYGNYMFFGINVQTVLVILFLTSVILNLNLYMLEFSISTFFSVNTPYYYWGNFGTFGNFYFISFPMFLITKASKENLLYKKLYYFIAVVSWLPFLFRESYTEVKFNEYELASIPPHEIKIWLTIIIMLVLLYDPVEEKVKMFFYSACLTMFLWFGLDKVDNDFNAYLFLVLTFKHVSNFLFKNTDSFGEFFVRVFLNLFLPINFCCKNDSEIKILNEFFMEKSDIDKYSGKLVESTQEPGVNYPYVVERLNIFGRHFLHEVPANHFGDSPKHLVKTSEGCKDVFILGACELILGKREKDLPVFILYQIFFFGEVYTNILDDKKRDPVWLRKTLGNSKYKRFCSDILKIPGLEVGGYKLREKVKNSNSDALNKAFEEIKDANIVYDKSMNDRVSYNDNLYLKKIQTYSDVKIDIKSMDFSQEENFGEVPSLGENYTYIREKVSDLPVEGLIIPDINFLRPPISINSRKIRKFKMTNKDIPVKRFKLGKVRHFLWNVVDRSRGVYTPKRDIYEDDLNEIHKSKFYLSKKRKVLFESTETVNIIKNRDLTIFNKFRKDVEEKFSPQSICPHLKKLLFVELLPTLQSMMEVNSLSCEIYKLQNKSCIPDDCDSKDLIIEDLTRRLYEAPVIDSEKLIALYQKLKNLIISRPSLDFRNLCNVMVKSGGNFDYGAIQSKLKKRIEDIRLACTKEKVPFFKGRAEFKLSDKNINNLIKNCFLHYSQNKFELVNPYNGEIMQGKKIFTRKAYMKIRKAVYESVLESLKGKSSFVEKKLNSERDSFSKLLHFFVKFLEGLKKFPFIIKEEQELLNIRRIFKDDKDNPEYKKEIEKFYNNEIELCIKDIRMMLY